MPLYSFTVKELKAWVNSIPAALDSEQVEYFDYDGMKEPRLDISISVKSISVKKSKQSNE